MGTRGGGWLYKLPMNLHLFMYDQEISQPAKKAEKTASSIELFEIWLDGDLPGQYQVRTAS